jgi:hypothetical protein
MNLVLPFVLSPLKLEFEFGAVRWHKGIDKVDLDLVDIDHMG